MCCLKIDTETLLANCLNTCKTYSFSPDDLQQIVRLMANATDRYIFSDTGDDALHEILTPPTIEIVGFLGGAARFITKPCLKQRVMRFPTVRYGCSV